jgi:hypothetical protein
MSWLRNRLLRATDRREMQKHIIDEDHRRLKGR